MPICNLCKNHFPVKIKINNKYHNLQRRKYCTNCSPFGSKNTRKLELPPISKEEKNKKYKRWQHKARTERKIKLVKLKGGACCICGYNKCITALEFHHIYAKEAKGFGFVVNGMLASWKKLIEELKKCILVCSNCHREIHHGMHPEFIKS